MAELAPSSHWQNAFYAACAWAIASVLGLAATSLGGVATPLELFRSNSVWVYFWILFVNPLASAIVVVTVFAHLLSRVKAFLWSRWGSAVAVLTVLYAVWGWLLLQKVAA